MINNRELANMTNEEYNNMVANETLVELRRLISRFAPIRRLAYDVINVLENAYDEIAILLDHEED